MSYCDTAFGLPFNSDGVFGLPAYTVPACANPIVLNPGGICSAPAEPQDAPGCAADAVPIGTMNTAAVITAPMIAFLSMATSLRSPGLRASRVSGSSARARLPATLVPLHEEGTVTTVGPREVHAPRGTELSCKGWQQEAAL